MFFLCIPLLAFASTSITSDIDTDTHWTTGGSPYVVNFDNGPYFPRVLTVASGVALTIDPGVIIKFGAYNGITINGTLRAEGTVGNPIIFTSLQDDLAGGDTNGDSIATTPTDEQWMHLEFSIGSAGIFDYAIVRYGGARLIPVVNTGIENFGGTLVINHTTLAHNGYDGFGQYGGNTIITNSTISNQTVGILVIGGTLDVNNSSIHDNAVGIENYSPFTIDARDNWWGTASGPYDEINNATGVGNGVYGDVVYSPWLTSNPFAIDPCAAPSSCASNVLFLPGIEASRLYRPDYAGGTDQLWEPNTDSDGNDLFLTVDGKSVRNDVYAKDVVDEAYASLIGLNIYKSFINQMDGLKTANTIVDWKAVPYDWRLSLDDILNSGNQFSDGRIYYSGDLAATSSPYIVQELRRLAKSSKTGKVTIVAHSNGGLVAKAFTEKLGSETSALIDKIIFVAVPQVGTPQAIGAILHGYDQGLPKDWISVFLSPKTARTLATNMPSAYNLLPSANYFTYVDDPVVKFDDSDFLDEFRARYGDEIHDVTQLKNFITDSRRIASSSQSDLKYPSVGNATLLSRAETLHTTLDTWAPPSGVSLYEIAGWGEDTLATIEYSEGKKSYCSNPSDIHTCTDVPAIMYSPKEVVEGDGTVLVPSALWTATSTGVVKYWVNLRDYDSPTRIERKHADILEVPELRTLINNILTNTTSTSFEFISTVQPAANLSDERLRFLLHSPLSLSATDNLGNTINSATSTIPGSRWKRYGEVQVLTVPKNTPLTLNLNGYTTGSFTLDIEEISGNNTIIASSTLSAVPSATSTTATMSFTDGTLQNASPLLLDYDGNGTTDFLLESEIGKEVVFDTTPPEAILAFDPVSQKIKIVGVDNLSSTIVSTTATSSTITDEAGNTLKIIFKKFKQEKKELKVEIREIRYNGVSARALPKIVLEYEWSTDKIGKLKEFEEEAIVGSLKVEGYYNVKKNVTKIGKKTLPGLVIIGIKTEDGSIKIDY